MLRNSRREIRVLTATVRAGVANREGERAACLTIKPGVHPIVPIMIGDATKSQKFAAAMLEKGVYVIGFFYPVVPHGTARVRTQVSAAHSREDLEFAANAFAEVNEKLK